MSKGNGKSKGKGKARKAKKGKTPLCHVGAGGTQLHALEPNGRARCENTHAGPYLAAGQPSPITPAGKGKPTCHYCLQVAA